MLSSFVEGRPDHLRVIAASRKRGHGAKAPATNGWIIVIGNQGAPRDCDRSVSPLLCTAYVSATSQYTPIARLFLCGKRTFSFSGGTLDAGDSAAFSSGFLASGFSCSQTESTPAPAPVTQTVTFSTGCYIVRTIIAIFLSSAPCH